MKSNTIFLSRNDVVYKGIPYDLDYFVKNVVNRKKRNIAIIGEDIYIKVYSVSNKEELKKDNIDLLIKKYFGNDDDYLINYEISKNKKNLYIYAVRGGMFIERLCEVPRLVNIVPIQIDIVKLCNRFIKKNEYIYIFEFKNLYYYIHIKDGYLIESFIRSNFEEIKEALNSIEESVYIDNCIKDKVNGDKINIKERSIYNEKVC